MSAGGTPQRSGSSACRLAVCRDAHAALSAAWSRAELERVEVACGGGRGRTGTALACIAVLDGVAADQAVLLIHEHHHARAIEMPWQRRFVARFQGP